MTLRPFFFCLLRRLAWLGLAALAPAFASPGAHGPNGEHLDGPPSAALAGSAQPRLEAHSELFEIVGRLESTELQLYLSRFETNEAVLKARVEVELGAAKAVAAFDTEAGRYVLRDKALLAALAQPGRHALVFTITAGTDTDLLDGTLAVAALAEAAPKGLAGFGVRKASIGLGLGLGLALVIATLALLRRRRIKGFGVAR